MAAKASDVPATEAPAVAATASAGVGFNREKRNEDEQHRGDAHARRRNWLCERS
jgi:hypothetical protein